MHPEHEREREIERVVGRALAALPAPRAPRTLLPRVMAAVAGRVAPRPWYTRAWLTWPWGWQVASVGALAVLVAGVVLISPFADGALDRLGALAGPASERAAALFHVADLVATVVRVLWHALLLPIAGVGLAIAMGVSLAGGACWHALNRLALTPEGSVHP